MRDIGAVYLYDGATLSVISTLKGSTRDNMVGSHGVTVLTNGNYVVTSRFWDNGGVADVGAVTFCSGTTGCTGVVSADNSLVGSTEDDEVGSEVTVLSDGDYVVRSPSWDNPPTPNVGAVTFCNGSTGCVGVVSAANSLVGSTEDDFVSLFVGYNGVTALSDGDYVVRSPSWDNPPTPHVGAVTFCNGSTGCVGVVSAANSLVGSTANDLVGNGGVTALSNGNYVVSSPSWSNPPTPHVGAVTFCNGSTGCVGVVVSTANSLVGSTAVTGVGSGGATALSNGNYVVSSPSWSNPSPLTLAVGAVTFCNGSTGCVGMVVSTANSLVGRTANDVVGNGGVTALSDGDYVVRSFSWNKSLTLAVVIVPESDPTLPSVSSGDNLPLAVGAVTFCNGNTGCVGVVSTDNSLVGSTEGDFVGVGGVTALSDGDYVVGSPLWDNPPTEDVGAATFCSGSTGCTGVVVSTANSLVGSSANDQVGFATALSDGDYVVGSLLWSNPSPLTLAVGAVTFCNGNTGCVGVVNAGNSLVGSTEGDVVGIGGVTALSDGGYVVRSLYWDNPPTADVGALTVGDGTTGTVGPITTANSLLGAVASAGESLNFAYDATRNRLAVGKPAENVVSLVSFLSLETASCGNGTVEGGESCDDGDTNSGDGCSDTCTVESGYSCSGEPSVCTLLCGDGNLDSGETCDDGNTANADGCTNTCLIEPGYTCSGTPSSCTPICGNGIVTGSEACDDGNPNNADGCSNTCTIESGYSCSGTPSSCTLLCGNGTIDAGEQCDMGSVLNGQADVCCSTTCTFKPVNTTCRSSAGVCDVVESCTGSSALCPSNGFAPSSQVCRPSTGAGDVAENCSGTSPICPPDSGVSDLVLTATPDSGGVGVRVTASWSGVTSPSARDWIGLYRTGAPNTSFLGWQYVNCTQSATTARASGSCGFQIGLVGTFEFRYFRNNGFTTLATSNVVTVGTVTALPTVTVTATTPIANEGGAEGQFTVTRTGSTTSALTVNYTLSGTAGNGPDYTALPGSLTLAAGVSSGVLPVLPVDDLDTEGNETVIVTLSANAAYTVGTPGSATVTIVDNETPPTGPVLTVSPSMVALGGIVTVSWSGVPTPRGNDWLGLYLAGRPNGAYEAWQYVNCTQTPGAARAAGSCTFQVRKRGTFEVRYFPNNGLTQSATSNAVTVP